jgi:hypothetical protein
MSIDRVAIGLTASLLAVAFASRGRVRFSRSRSAGPPRGEGAAKERSAVAPYAPVVREYERKGLLERVEREAATVGARIPEEIEVQGEPIDLQSFVFEIKRRETVPPGERDRVERAKRNLRRERLERLERIEENEVSYERGEELAASIIGIDRALEALEGLNAPDPETEAKRQEAADRKRWMNFLKKALGREDAGGGRTRF